MTTATINAADGGSFSAYLALPEGESGPGMLVIQEIFGVNKVMRDICDAYAAKGYVAICPDLFWRIEPGIDITDQSDEEWKKAFELYQAFDVDKGVEDLKSTLAFLRDYDGCTGKVGTVGYCLGGNLAYQMAAQSNADASVGYYGVGIEGLLGEAGNISKPLMLHIAGEDQFVPKDAQQKIHEALDSNGNVTLHDYPQQDHAFARIGGAHFDRASADAANQRSAEFFKTHLG
jgi:carboxymethylenebutenolidase